MACSNIAAWQQIGSSCLRSGIGSSTTFVTRWGSVPEGDCGRRRGRGTGGCSNEGSNVGIGPFRSQRCCCCLGQHHLKQLSSIRNRPEIFGQNYEHRFNTLSLMEANFIRFVMRGATKRNEYFCSHLSLHTVILYIKRAFRRFLAHEDRCQNIVKQLNKSSQTSGHTHTSTFWTKFYIHLSFCQESQIEVKRLLYG